MPATATPIRRKKPSTPAAKAAAPKAVPVVDMAFPAAMQAVLDGKKVSKRDWKNDGIYVWMTEGFLKIHHASGKEDALLVSDGDLLGTDWYVVRAN